MNKINDLRNILKPYVTLNLRFKGKQDESILDASKGNLEEQRRLLNFWNNLWDQPSDLENDIFSNQNYFHFIAKIYWREPTNNKVLNIPTFNEDYFINEDIEKNIKKYAEQIYSNKKEKERELIFGKVRGNFEHFFEDVYLVKSCLDNNYMIFSAYYEKNKNDEYDDFFSFFVLNASINDINQFNSYFAENVIDILMRDEKIINHLLMLNPFLKQIMDIKYNISQKDYLNILKEIIFPINKKETVSYEYIADLLTKPISQTHLQSWISKYFINNKLKSSMILNRSKIFKEINVIISNYMQNDNKNSIINLDILPYYNNLIKNTIYNWSVLMSFKFWPTSINYFVKNRIQKISEIYQIQDTILYIDRIYRILHNSTICVGDFFDYTHKAIPSSDDIRLADEYWSHNVFLKYANRLIVKSSYSELIAICQVFKKHGHNKIFIKHTASKVGIWSIDMSNVSTYEEIKKLIIDKLGDLLFCPNEKIIPFIVQPFINFRNEYRFFIVNGKILKGVPVRRKDNVFDNIEDEIISPYICFAHDNYDRVKNEEKVKKYTDFVNKIIQHQNFNIVIDIGEDEYGNIYPIEFNNLLKSGRYGYNGYSLYPTLLKKNKEIYELIDTELLSIQKRDDEDNLYNMGDYLMSYSE